MKCFDLVTSCATRLLSLDPQLKVTDIPAEGGIERIQMSDASLEASSNSSSSSSIGDPAGPVWLDQPQSLDEFNASGKSSMSKSARRLTLPDLFDCRLSPPDDGRRCSWIDPAIVDGSSAESAAATWRLGIPAVATCADAVGCQSVRISTTTWSSLHSISNKSPSIHLLESTLSLPASTTIHSDSGRHSEESNPSLLDSITAAGDIHSTKPLIGEMPDPPLGGNWTSAPHLAGFSARAKRSAGPADRQSRSTYGLNQPQVEGPTFAQLNSSIMEGSASHPDAADAEVDRLPAAPISNSMSSSSFSNSIGTVAVPSGPRFKLLSEGDIQLCRLTHSGTVISKILSSKFLRRWETHHVYLNDAWLSSKTTTGFMEDSVPYSSMKEVTVIVGWDGGHRHCIRIVVPEGSILLQANNAYVRDQWYHSIIWKKNLFRYHQITRQTTRQEVLLKEVKSMVDLATSTPLQDHCIAQAPFQVISSLLSMEKQWALPHTVLEDLLATLSPLLETQQPTLEMCTAFSRHCQSHPRSSLVRGLFTTIVHRILKHNVDFGKHPYMRRFVQDYVRVLYAHNDGPEAVRNFVRSGHGLGSACPHPRVLPNLVAVCLAAVFSIYDLRRQRMRQGSWTNLVTSDENDHHNDADDANSDQSWHMLCYLLIIKTIAEFDDWRPGLSQLLQPVPFPDDALADEVFISGMATVVGAIGTDQRCSVHQCVLGIRDGKEGWFHVVCPSSAACPDDGSLWATILKTLLDCCCRRKAFVASMTKLLGACQLLALRDQSSAQEVLCLMLEWSLLENKTGDGSATTGDTVDDHNTLPLQVATTLQSTDSGRRRYFELCDRQLHLKELQQKGGPKKLTLPNRSTDNDLFKLLNCGSFGNLECLSLAFTQVTSACAHHLIKLPSLRYLNLWSTQFGDSGLQLISEHLHKLQVLNLCETPVTDKGLSSLQNLKSLRKLNLNSTTLSVSTFENLKQKLPSLQECDVRYTDAW